MVDVKRSHPNAIKDLTQLIENLGRSEGKVGWFESARYEDGTPVAYIASIQEYGSPSKNIPPRLGMRFTAMAKRDKWRSTAEILAKNVIKKSISEHAAMEQFTQIAEGDVLEHISSNPPPPLKPKTLASRKRRGRGTQTLNDSGYMIATISHRVDEGAQQHEHSGLLESIQPEQVAT